MRHTYKDDRRRGERENNRGVRDYSLCITSTIPYIFIYKKKQSKVERNANTRRSSGYFLKRVKGESLFFFSSSLFHLSQEMSVRRGKTVGTRQKWGVQSHKSKKMIATTTTTKKRRKRIRERERDVILFISCSNISMVVVGGKKKIIW